jgi:hypothetical protein
MSDDAQELPRTRGIADQPEPVVFNGPQFASDREMQLEKELAAAKAELSMWYHGEVHRAEDLDELDAARAELAEKTRQVELLALVLQKLGDRCGKPTNPKFDTWREWALAEARKEKV